jgi:hypothetical protein
MWNAHDAKLEVVRALFVPLVEEASRASSDGEHIVRGSALFAR